MRSGSGAVHAIVASFRLEAARRSAAVAPLADSHLRLVPPRALSAPRARILAPMLHCVCLAKQALTIRAKGHPA